MDDVKENENNKEIIDIANQQIDRLKKGNNFSLKKINNVLTMAGWK